MHKDKFPIERCAENMEKKKVAMEIMVTQTVPVYPGTRNHMFRCGSTPANVVSLDRITLFVLGFNTLDRENYPICARFQRSHKGIDYAGGFDLNTRRFSFDVEFSGSEAADRMRRNSYSCQSVSRPDADRAIKVRAEHPAAASLNKGITIDHIMNWIDWSW